MIHFNRAELRDRIYACWLGKNIGGTMGTPFEGTKELLDIQGFTSEPGKPLPNDDLDLQLVWLKALAEVGPNSLDAKVLGEYWLTYIGPPWNEYGAGKANMRMGIVPPMSGELNNEDWKHSNGAWIRTEVWACTHPALPERAIRFAFEDACVDHGFGEGSNAAVFVAAMQSAAFVVDDIDKLIDIGLSKIPEDCRVARSIRIVLDCYEKGVDWKDCRAAIVKDSEDLGWFQAPANVAFVILGLKYGQGDFKKSMILTINCGDDTDCTGATLGATMGIMHGTKMIPADWRAYIGDDIITISIIKGSAFFPETCTQLTDLVMDLLPVTTYAGFFPKSARRVPHYVEISDAPFSISEGFDPDHFKGRGFVNRLFRRKRYSYIYANEILKALVEYDHEPCIAAGESIRVRLTVSQTNCTSYRRAAIKWHLPEGFSVAGRTNVFLKWLPGGEEREDALNYRADDANFTDLTITAGEKVDSVNRIIIEITTPGQCQPLLVPITLLA
jgi:ADP-ribosylglycohydrolase